jgi:hypothetical protein
MLAVAAGMSSVEAGVIYNFSFVETDNTRLSGKLVGQLQSDNNTVIVSSVSDLKRNGVSVAGSYPILNSYTSFATNGSSFVPPLVSLNFNTMDLYVSNVERTEGFFFAPAQFFGFRAYKSTPLFGNQWQQIASHNWTLTATASAAVPEPSSIALLGFGAVGLFARARRRRRQAKLSV